MLAVVGISGEWRHRTITSSLLAAPDRLRFLTAKTLAFAAAGLALSLLIAVAIGSVVRNQPVAIVGILILLVVVEPLLLSLAPDVGRYGPFNALPSGVQDLSAEDQGFDGAEFLEPGPALLAILAWIGVFFAAGATLPRRRDLNA